MVAIEKPVVIGGARGGLDRDADRFSDRLAAFDSTITSQLVYQLFAYLPNVAAAVLVLLIGNILARFLARSVLIGAVNMNLEYARVLSAGVKWLILVLAIAIALDHLGIGGSIVRLAFGILFGGIVLALALAGGTRIEGTGHAFSGARSESASRRIGTAFPPPVTARFFIAETRHLHQSQLAVETGSVGLRVTPKILNN